MNTKFRGKVQMAFASIFPISDKSGVNQKGLYNPNKNRADIHLNNKQSEEHLLNISFYKQFWVVFNYLTDPLKVIII
jgi:hypothetical protein